MAESKRRGKESVDDRVDDDFQDAADETLVDGDAEFEADEATPATRRSRGTRDAAGGGTATRTRAKASPPKPPSGVRTRTEDRPGPWARLVRFFREIAAELRKVIWPTRNELVTYTTVVVVFVTVIVAIVAGLDVGFSKLALQVFGK